MGPHGVLRVVPTKEKHMTDERKNDGGSAFAHGSPEHGGSPGMTLRDWFATHATEQDINRHRPTVSVGYGIAHFECSAEEARYRYADAMLKARGH